MLKILSWLPLASRMKQVSCERQLSSLISRSTPPPRWPVWSRSPSCWLHGLCPAPAAWLILPQGCLSPPGCSSHTTFFCEACCSFSPISSHIWTLLGISATLGASGTSHRQLSWHILVNLLYLTPQGVDALVPGSKHGYLPSPQLTAFPLCCHLPPDA